ncbi:xanthine dehydrogenase family protein molybdopterin-binding subunit [Novosphingobium taihuense]|uniref:CO/xanthine dehydrogenase Mo-binding subunit n=1 Tax=Novosphingobium taihuense TaxID=260085 RepID=A0A7W7A8F8_9SPHN|nr:molybdopterin cofactor-binding domain-containing protein [Novosphingobium taihuense]MBB4612354.1 CO/xanthine dehydrogenase Mo-binding subunit [Novosphingobium taihuense]TWH88293.1 CO/xanthine dehydrogenase Mo-binding subunit [Novosphingobium taihuense]
MSGLTDIHGARLSRRAFIGTGGALAVAVGLPVKASAEAGAKASLDAAVPANWIEIDAAGAVTIRTGKCDFGQSSVNTAYRQIVAEELCVPLSAMTTVITGDTDRTPDGGGTFWLLGYVQNLRKVAAYMREAALEVAAGKLGVDRKALSVKDGVISGGGKAISYAQLVKGQDLKLTIPVEGELTSPMGLTVKGDPPMKPVSEYTIIGKPSANPMTRPKVSGEAVWVGDVTLPGMLHARTIHPATLGSKLVKAGKLDSAQFPGARLVTIGNLLAVVSPDEWEAVQAAQAVAAETQWSEWKGLPGHEGLAEHLRSKADWSAFPVRDGAANKGEPEKVATAHEHKASYFLPYHKHAPISPMVTLADYRPDGSVTLHTLSQNPQHLRHMIAKMLGTGEEKVVVRTYPGSGHYGRSNGGSAGSEDEAVLLSRELGRPVRVQWMRADDMQWTTQSSCALADIDIRLDKDGRIAGYSAQHHVPPMQDDRLVGAILAGLPVIESPAPASNDPFQVGITDVQDTWVYGAVPAVREKGLSTWQIGEKESPLAVGLRDHSMRTPIQFQQNFPRELAISEAAMLAGKDALQFRLDHITDPRFKAILEKLRTESGWDSRPSPAPGARASGKGTVKGRGLSIMLRDNGYWACAAHVSVTPESGEVKVERMTMVADVGIVINPLQLRRQIQAGCLMGVSQALHEEVTFDQGAITSVDWASYPILTMAEMPQLKIVFETNLAAGNYGQGSESANALAAPAIAGAVLDATGRPVRRLPLRPDYVKAALV